MPSGRPQASWSRQMVLSEGYGHGGPGVCLVDSQTEAEGVPWQGGRGDPLFQRMPLPCHPAYARPDLYYLMAVSRSVMT